MSLKFNNIAFVTNLRGIAQRLKTVTQVIEANSGANDDTLSRLDTLIGRLERVADRLGK